MRYITVKVKTREELNEQHPDWDSRGYRGDGYIIRARSLYGMDITNELPAFYSSWENVPEKVTLENYQSQEIPKEYLNYEPAQDYPFMVIPNGLQKTFN